VGLIDRRWVRDDVAAIATEVRDGAACDLLVFCGGTGIAVRDVTIEAVTPLLDKSLPGFGEHFRRVSVDKIGPSGLLSRAHAGVRGKTLIACLPGSPGAVADAVPILRGLLAHAHALLSGHTTHLPEVRHAP
jgi:molybdenum cofactor biosynthesis protein B